MRCYQLGEAISKGDSALGNTSVAVNNEADISAGSIEALGPGGVDGGDADADDLEVLLLVGAGGKSLELVHSVGGRINVNTPFGRGVAGDAGSRDNVGRTALFSSNTSSSGEPNPSNETRTLVGSNEHQEIWNLSTEVRSCCGIAF